MINRVSQKNALSELPFWETGFEGAWPSNASWLLNWQGCISCGILLSGTGA